MLLWFVINVSSGLWQWFAIVVANCCGHNDNKNCHLFQNLVNPIMYNFKKKTRTGNNKDDGD